MWLTNLVINLVLRVERKVIILQIMITRYYCKLGSTMYSIILSFVINLHIIIKTIIIVPVAVQVAIPMLWMAKDKVKWKMLNLG